MKLSVGDRIQILNILPAAGNVLTLRVVLDMQRELGFTEEELAILDFQQTGEKVSWNSGVEDKEFALGKAATGLIYTQLQQMELEERLPLALLSLWDKFVPSPEQEEQATEV